MWEYSLLHLLHWEFQIVQKNLSLDWALGEGINKSNFLISYLTNIIGWINQNVISLIKCDKTSKLLPNPHMEEFSLQRTPLELKKTSFAATQDEKPAYHKITHLRECRIIHHLGMLGFILKWSGRHIKKIQICGERVLWTTTHYIEESYEYFS